MRSQHALDKWHHASAMENIQLSGILLEDSGERELFDCAPAVVWRVQCDVCWRRIVCGGLFNSQESLGGRRSPCLGWTQSQEDLEEVVRLL